MNASEHEAFVKSVHDVMPGRCVGGEAAERAAAGRRKAPLVVVETRVEFDDEASSHSTLLEVVAQDTTGLLRALSLTLAARVQYRGGAGGYRGGDGDRRLLPDAQWGKLDKTRSGCCGGP
jgi:hypothetical protein